MENGRSRLQQAQQDVDEVCDIMMDNLNKASEREGKLGELEDRADQLLEQSKVFSKTATQVKQKKQWENMKLKVILAIIVGVVVLAIIIVLIVSLTGSKKNEGEGP
ncbi:vesicle-associated membrane protein 5-like [Clarias gariepinus]|uniref:vesicle-associated membrane protein 5 n=1 Tax=Clarias gariepinus TaxID=13013 RepID=UPI00234D1A16|nr:vesicle-associated membrane protein 5 [Clarias gariepinus]